ncbi:MAG: CCA tRNA nucleotidyltransferase, partial [Defluviitaleaceae bacterium]|nr:CCA tRNA nucleotidyltransferase [Defluviitaleaceae bacterium]
MKISKNAKKIIETLNNANFEAYVVGGCVRDSLMGKVPKDFDITTSAKPEEVIPLFKKVFETGIQHGTVTVVLDSENFEVTTYRLDGEYKDNRRPEQVFFTSNLEEDLTRRDFTINAIAYHPENGYFDPYGGTKDIENKLIKGVGNADTRFKEDALRMMRAIRFSSQLGFSIEENTLNALSQNVGLIEHISIERTRDEFLKAMLGDYLDNALMFNKYEIFKYV